MILGLEYIAIIASSEESVSFYKRLGFTEQTRTDRSHDFIVLLHGYCITLEIYVDPSHLPRTTNPEAMGLRHLALEVDDLEDTVSFLNIQAEPVRERNGRRFTFFKDPDGVPIELCERKEKT